MTRTKVAIIEDDDILSFLLREICTAAGWQVVGTARSASDGLRVVDEHKPDALILDFALEGEHDGIEVLVSVRERHPAVKTILITAWDYSTLQSRIDFVQPDHMLRKPVFPNELEKVLQGIAADLGGPQLADAA